MQAERVGQLEDDTFVQHWTVAFWRDYRFPADAGLLSPAGRLALVNKLVQHAQSADVLRDPESAAYWAYHVMRMALFMTAGLLGNTIASFQSGALGRGKMSFFSDEQPMIESLERTLVVRPHLLARKCMMVS